jgi:tetratricopeptide (TPR) repeat protein
MRAILGILLATLTTTGALSETGEPPAVAKDAEAKRDAVDELIQQALQDARAGRNAEALASLDPMALAVTNRIAEVKDPVYCARSETEAKGYQARATPTSRKVQFAPARLCDVLFMRAYVLENLHRVPEALEQLRQVVTLEPDFPHFQVEYAAALRQSGDLASALTAYRRAAQIAAPIKEYSLDQAAALRGIGFILTEQDDLDGAEQAYRQSLALAPDNPLALHELSYIAHLRATHEKTPARTVETTTDSSLPPKMDNN